MKQTYLQVWTIIIMVRTVTTNIISTAQGRIRGTLRDGYVSYEGIPYGSISRPAERFKRAGLAPTWQGVRESHTSSCSLTSNPEDCLQLDVNVPTSGSRSWPVLAWVAGGGGHYNSSKLVQRGIILVIVYHRYGPNGFLCSKEYQIPGNAGVKDVVLALGWIRDNIVAFKGSPAHVVLAGQSLGAAMLEALLLSSNGYGLYHGAILQSGTIFAPWAFNYDAEERVRALSNLIESGNNTVETILNAEIEDLVYKANLLEFPYISFGICKDVSLKYDEPVVVEDPMDVKVKTNPVPIIIGFNSEEAYVFTSVLKDTKNTKNLSTDLIFLLPELKYLNEKEIAQVSKQIKDAYFARNTSMKELLTYYSDAYFINHIYRSANLHASSNVPVYLYQFSHVGKLGVEPGSGAKTGAAHTDELGYLFSNKNLGDEDAIVQDYVLELWSNFVKYFNPNPKGSLPWEQLNPHHPRLLDITTESKMIDFPRTSTARMLNDIYEKCYNNMKHSVP